MMGLTPSSVFPIGNLLDILLDVDGRDVLNKVEPKSVCYVA